MATHLISRNGIRLTLDPTDNFASISDNQLMETLGIIPRFFTDKEAPIWEQVENAYGFPMCDLDGGTVGEDLHYRYPEDPALAPVAMYQTDTEVMLQYQYAICAIYPKGKPELAKVTRID